MYVYQLVAQFLQHRQRHGRVVDEGAALACSRQFAPYDGVLGVIFYLVFVEQGLQLIVCQVEVSLNHALVSPLFQGLGVGPLSEQQSYGTEYDALACTRLAGNDREAPMQLYVEFVNQGEVPDVKLFQHVSLLFLAAKLLQNHETAKYIAKKSL